jgi:hypothetical protein
MNNTANNPTPNGNTPPRPLYQLTRLIAMLERQAEANLAREAANHLAATAPPPRKVLHDRPRNPDTRDSPAQV